ncbi:MAG TPA: hypothetical protein VFC93_03970 [Chloroflexota bacterium]|nr:hypothetical protein [Chloroflexota bacterium]
MSNRASLVADDWRRSPHRPHGIRAGEEVVERGAQISIRAEGVLPLPDGNPSLVGEFPRAAVGRIGDLLHVLRQPFVKLVDWHLAVRYKPQHPD